MGDSYSYDTADRLQPTGARGTLRYDAIDYYVDDLVKTLTQGPKTSTFDTSSR